MEDQKFLQNVMRYLPKPCMQRYFQERDADPDFKIQDLMVQPTVVTSDEEQKQDEESIALLRKHSKKMIGVIRNSDYSQQPPSLELGEVEEVKET